jgi:hypothetical protein
MNSGCRFLASPLGATGSPTVRPQRRASEAVLVYIVLRFDQAIRGASKNLSAVLKDGREFRQESRAEFDRVWRRIETFERERERE